MNGTELFSQHFSLTNIIRSQHPYGFASSLKVSRKQKRKLWFRFLFERISESEVLFDSSRSQNFLAVVIVISFSASSLNFERMYKYYKE